MATIKSRPNSTGVISHTVCVRYKGIEITETFRGANKNAADAWGRAVEVAIDRGTWPDRDLVPKRLHDKYFPPIPDQIDIIDPLVPSVGWTMYQAFEFYFETVTRVVKKGIAQEMNRIRTWQRHPLAKKRLDQITEDDIQNHIGARMAENKASTTIRNEVFLLSALYSHAQKKPIPGGWKIDNQVSGWGLTKLINPTKSVTLPKPAPHRDRRLVENGFGEPEEERKLLAALQSGPDGAEMAALFMLAIETSMRLTELLLTTAGEIQREAGAVSIRKEDSKNNQPRKVVLSSRARALIDERLSVVGTKSDTRLFSLKVDALEYRWRKAREKAEVKGLKWHDLRHEGLSRMADKGLTLGDLQGQSGHRTTQVLMGYLNVRASDVARKLG